MDTRTGSAGLSHGPPPSATGRHPGRGAIALPLNPQGCSPQLCFREPEGRGDRGRTSAGVHPSQQSRDGISAAQQRSLPEGQGGRPLIAARPVAVQHFRERAVTLKKGKRSAQKRGRNALTRSPDCNRCLVLSNLTSRLSPRCLPERKVKRQTSRPRSTGLTPTSGK